MDDYNVLLPTATDVSDAFERMDQTSFRNFLKTKAEEAVLVIQCQLTGNYSDDNNVLVRLQNFLNQTPAMGQKRFAVVKATQEQSQEHADNFAGGIKWEKIDG
jgi:hypothetical protein